VKRPRKGSLTPDEEQRLFHAALPGWDASMVAQRDRLGYRPDLRPERESVLATDGRLWAWGRTIGEHLETTAAREVDRLGLPALFGRYWTACFLSDYGARHLEGIRDYGPQAFGRVGVLGRVYPPRQTLTVLVTSTGPDAMPILRIEGLAALVTRETLLDAVERALRLLPKATWPSHPLLTGRKARAGAIVRARPDKRHVLAVKLDSEGKSSREIADEIALRWPDRREWHVEPSTVRRWLRPPG